MHVILQVPLVGEASGEGRGGEDGAAKDEEDQ